MASTTISGITTSTTAAPSITPELTASGILVAVLVLVLLVVVGTGAMDVKAAFVFLILISHFAGIISKYELLSGFSNPGTTAVALIGILVDPIGKLPIVEKVARSLFGGEKGHRTWQLTKILVVTAFFSLLLPNAPHAQLFTPLVRNAAIATGMNPQYALLAMSNIISASNSVLIGSSSNLIAAGALDVEEAKRTKVSGKPAETLGMFDLAISNLVPTVVAIIYCLIAAKLMFDEDLPEDEEDGVVGEAVAIDVKKEGDDGDDKKKKKEEDETDAAVATADVVSPQTGTLPKTEEEATAAAAAAAADKQLQRDENAKKEKEMNQNKIHFMSQTKFSVLFQVFRSSHAAELTIGKTVNEIIDFLPLKLQKAIVVDAVEPSLKRGAEINVKPSFAPSSASTTTGNNNEESINTNEQEQEQEQQEQPQQQLGARTLNDDEISASPFVANTGDQQRLEGEDALNHLVQPNDRIIVTGQVQNLRAFRTLLGLAWVGISEISAFTSSRFQRNDAPGEDEADADDSQEMSEVKFVGTPSRDDDGNNAKSPKKSKSSNEPHAHDGDDDDAGSAKAAKRENNMPLLKSRALYEVKSSAEGLDAFLPTDGPEMEKVRVAIVVIAHNNPAIGQRLESRLFADQFRATILAARRYTDNYALHGRAMAMHVLQAGDTLLLRIRPRSAPVFQNKMNLTNFYDVEGLDKAHPLEGLLTDNYIIVPSFILQCCDCGETVVTKLGTQRVIRLPDWWMNVTLVVFIGVVAAAAAGKNLSAIAACGVSAYVILGIMNVKQAIKAVDWVVVTGIALSFGVSTAMNNSGLAQVVGGSIGDSGLSGYPMLFVSCLITAVIASVLQNKGGVQTMFPIVLAILDKSSVDNAPKIAAVVASNACVAGFFTAMGCPSHFVIAPVGDYSASSFFIMGLPLMVIYCALTAAFIQVQYSL